jgi:hypothetical protein
MAYVNCKESGIMNPFLELKKAKFRLPSNYAETLHYLHRFRDCEDLLTRFLDVFSESLPLFLFVLEGTI